MPITKKGIKILKFTVIVLPQRFLVECMLDTMYGLKFVIVRIVTVVVENVSRACTSNVPRFFCAQIDE